MRRIYKTKGEVKKFPQKGGWVYLSIQQTYSDLGIEKPKWGLVPASITVGKTTWKKSLLPMGDESLFIALNEKVRKSEKIKVGDEIVASFTLI